MEPLDVFTAEITNTTITATDDDGLTKISVFNGSAVAGTITGTKKAFGLSPSAINIAQNETVTITASDANRLTGLTIVAPSNCTLKVIAI